MPLLYPRLEWSIVNRFRNRDRRLSIGILLTVIVEVFRSTELSLGDRVLREAGNKTNA
jgi:hypothetical protein